MLSEPLLTIDKLTHRYRADDPPVLENLSLSLAAGQTLGVLGPSGSGKSTLLNLIAALDTPTAGRIVFDGRNLGDLSPADQARLRGQRLGFIFQQHHLLASCTVRENVLVPTVPLPDDPTAADRATELLERVGLGGRGEDMPAELSVGQQQRVAVVRAMINQPDLILADEPTGSLDRKTAGTVADLLMELASERGSAVLVATHDHHLAERCAQVRQLCDGQLWEARSP